VQLAEPFEIVQPAHLLIPAWDYTKGPEVADFNAVLGFAPDPEQELWLDAAFGVRDGLPAAEELTEIAGRQNLKSAEFEMTCFGWLFITKEHQILWSAHEVDTAKTSFLHMVGLLEKKAWAMKLVRRFYYGNGNYSIAMKDGRTLNFTARTTAAGRGKSAPKAIWDEALELLGEHVAAQDAIKSTFPWAQQLIGSSGAKSYSEVLHGFIDRGRAKVGDRSFYREFCDDLPGECELGDECTHVVGSPGCRLDDPDRYKRANPMLGRIRPDGRGLTLRAIEKERRNQPDPLLFARERLTWHEKLAEAKPPVFSEDAWTALKDSDSKIHKTRIFALQVSPDLDWSAIVVGGYNRDGKVHLETTSAKADPDKPRVYNRRPSTDWVVPWFKERAGKGKYRQMTLVILEGSAAMSLVPALKKIPGLILVILPSSSLPAACGHLLGIVSRGEVTHVGDRELTASMTAVGKKTVGEKAFVWSPRSSKGDITAAMAATLIAWRLELGADYDPEKDVG
jgi:hypothetical protein